ncbi:exonuclease domain-containing protein [Alteromonas confluentis]|uniref:DNA-directed DNA polymerase n=1 Tax=Alteromonas confluentis TaxID=1656094 RepID=A0A1E7Z8I4_9ALTE|nr:exonuclease domain-containing protein [Alteromonas confluentis]OFC69838.1 DNA polymerase III subunit epsilon [Alteromonas confluentis]
MRKTLPEKYYLDHFSEFLAFFSGASAALLDEKSRRFIADFQALPEPQQCIIARAANRKYAIINREHFYYEEINQPQVQLDALITSGWFGPLSEAPVWEMAGMLTKADVLQCLRDLGVSGFVVSAKKAELMTLLFDAVETQGWPSSLSVEHLLFCRFDSAMRYLLFLYFGNNKGRLNQFSMRDLGIMRTRQQAVSDQARFDIPEDAQAAFHYASGADEFDFLNNNELLALGAKPQPETFSTISQVYAERYHTKLGSKLLSIDRHAALQFLEKAPGDAAKEKWLREAYKEGRKDEVKAQLEAIIDSPASDTLLAFAEDFYQRKYHKKRTSVVTDMLRNASRTLQLDESQNQAVEQGVIAWYKRHNIEAWRTENRLWRSLFALTFWPILFEKDAPVTEFDRRPQSLKNNNFYTTFHTDIDALLAKVDNAAALMKHIAAMAAAHYGKANSLFLWGTKVLDPIKGLLAHAPIEQVLQVIKMMAEDFNSLRDGFPDIMVLENGLLRFEEIKAPGDQLRRNQLVSIQKLQQAGFEVQITQVSWYRDPQQPYAVVDIETTGGHSQYHRITEVGIVKIVNGEVVDEWQSLINPQRHIPSNITRLTGISNDMVVDAPVFAEIADAIDEFTQDCVFVAHNVNFDYGFIKQEFARLERPFRRPKLCTVRESRKAFPGLPSYSLANLTKHFEVKMEQHHRALSDARAAAELLVMSQQVD